MSDDDFTTHLPSVVEPSGWNRRYLEATKIRRGGETSRAYVTKAGNVRIRKGGEYGSTRDRHWQLSMYRNAMTRQGREVAFQTAA